MKKAKEPGNRGDRRSNDVRKSRDDRRTRGDSRRSAKGQMNRGDRMKSNREPKV
jgi:hypothetical protein